MDGTGIALRGEHFCVVLETATAFSGTTATSAEIVSLILGSHGEIRRPDDPDGRVWPALGYEDRARLALLAALVHTDNWRSGQPCRKIGNRELAQRWDCTERAVRAILSRLEGAGFLVRRYNAWNRRHAQGIDLSPLGAALPHLIALDQQGRESLAAHTTQWREDRDETEALQGRQTSSNPEAGVRPSYKVQDKDSQNPLDHASEGVVFHRRPASPPASDEDLFEAMVEVPVVAEAVPPGRRSVKTVVTVLAELRRVQFPTLRPSAWDDAVKRHGLAAYAAVVVALSRARDEAGAAIRNKTAYLARMLADPKLGRSVLFQLTAQEGRGRGRPRNAPTGAPA